MGERQLLKELKLNTNSSLMKKCASTIEDLQDEIQRLSKINQQQKQLIQILQEGKEYYQSEFKNNTYQHQFKLLKQEQSYVSSLLNAHRKANYQLKEKVYELQAQINQKNQSIRNLEKKMETISLQKIILQKEWNKVVKAVKRKINKIEEQGYQPQIKNITTIKQNKQNVAPAHRQLINKKENIPSSANIGSLMDRTAKMIKLIDDKLAIRQLQDIFNASASSGNGSNKKQYPILTEINKNVQFPFNIQFL